MDGDDPQPRDIFGNIIDNYVTGVIVAAQAPPPLLPPLREPARPK
jgi:hypothetical protein